MLETIIPNARRWRCLTIALLVAVAGALASCASEPKQAALVSDPDAHQASAIPWNKPAKWEGREGLPDTGTDAFGGSGGSRY